ncbi:motility associated factor glycosyltransferase family protein [Paraneptunicella aestuarii]|uniref:motility associated factor glycosyltransferase family protein n=1 Tax=Paraneptunicella aestuarii TaxID=2831148 RepID=UPI001E410417|nr:6-hydroxymethylpterin diphosphokinase MptE-like protein [Paraneptunicella aestuarii]UAA37812.1 motility associated factor glycosyltransferase family protein [Paraneptunicella aestuarii]
METFQKNLNFLSQHQPELFKKFVNFRPVKLLSNASLVNDIELDGEPFYGMDGRIASEMQVKHYFNFPTHYSLTYRSQPGNGFLHQVVINNLNEKAKQLGYKPRAKPLVSNLLALGSGLGFQIAALQQQLTFANIILVEPEDEMLFHFLHYTDIDKLSQQCAQLGGTFNILQPSSYQAFADMTANLAEQIGYNVFAEISVFRHYETPLFDNILENFKDLRNSWVSAWGFMDDELIGLLHTLDNAKTHSFVADTDATANKSKTFILVGNGPSLDKDIDTLKKYQDKFIIVSCGTALATLIRAGIKPDFHAEMERSNFTPIVQNKWFTQEFCDSTTLLALNTVSSAITRQFSSCLLFTKGQDVGAHILEKAGEHKFTQLYYCNPTVANFALSASLAMGAGRIVLLGCDLGFRETGKHHASGSDYFEANSRLANIQPHAEMKAVDNQNRAIATTRILNLARKNMEKLASSHNNTELINCSNGVKIAGFQWQSFEAFANQHAREDKETSFTLSLIDLEFKPHQIQPVMQHYMDTANHIISILEQEYKEHHIHKLFNQVAKYLTQIKDLHRADIFFSGITKYFAACTAGHLSRIASNKRQEYCDFALQEIINMFQRAITKLDNLTKEKQL